MKRIAINLSLSILLFITSIITIFSLTILNDNFLLKNIDDSGFYNKIDNNKKDTRYDIKKYIKNRFYVSNLTKNDKEYQNKICFFKNNKKTRYYIYLFYLVNILLIVISGIIFNKTKKIHNIYNIFIITFIITLFVYGYYKLFINIDNYLISCIINNYFKYVLGLSIILLEIAIYKKYIKFGSKIK